MKNRMMTACLIAGCLLSMRVAAQVPTMISTQGRISVAGVNFDGSGRFKFALVDGQQSPRSLWSNDGSSINGAEPTSHVQLPVVKGLYTVVLGDSAISNMVAVSTTIFTNSTVYLRTWFDDNAHGFQQLQPDQRIASVGYAMMAGNVPDGSVSAAKIAAGAVGSNQLAPGAVTSTQLATNAVQAIHLADGSITSAKLSKPPQAGTILGADMVLTGDGTYTSHVNFPLPFQSLPSVLLTPVTQNPFFPSVTDVTGAGFDVKAQDIRISFRYEIESIGRVSLATVNGNPAVAYTTTGSLDLKYARALDSLGRSWGPPILVDGSGIIIGGYPSLSVVNGNPAIAYTDSTTGSGNLRYIRANDANGASWSPPVIADSSSRVGEYSSLCIVNGRPAVGYHDGLNGNLKFVRANEENGSTWATPITVDNSANDVGQSCQMIIVNGNPAIAYRNATASDLKYVRAANLDGTSWGGALNIDTISTVVEKVSIAIVSGKPAISYYVQSSANAIYYTIAADANGGSWTPSISVMEVNTEGPSLAVIDGSPAIAFTGGQNIYYIRANDTTGVSWGMPNFLGKYQVNITPDVHLQYINGFPMIASGYEFRKAANSTGSNWSNFSINWIAIPP